MEGGEGERSVHLCSKCKWPFANAYPSQKKCAAHRRQCGKIEGYPILSTSAKITKSDGDVSSSSSSLDSFILNFQNWWFELILIINSCVISESINFISFFALVFFFRRLISSFFYFSITNKSFFYKSG